MNKSLHDIKAFLHCDEHPHEAGQPLLIGVLIRVTMNQSLEDGESAITSHDASHDEEKSCSPLSLISFRSLSNSRKRTMAHVKAGRRAWASPLIRLSDCEHMDLKRTKSEAKKDLGKPR